MLTLSESSSDIFVVSVSVVIFDVSGLLSSTSDICNSPSARVASDICSSNLRFAYGFCSLRFLF